MSEQKQVLLGHLEQYYRDCGWKVERAEDGTVRAAGVGGVTWIGLAVTSEDIAEAGFEDRLVELSDQRMPDGALCPFELLPDESCARELRELLGRLRLAERGHVEVSSLAA
jgi:hypothetical protein